MQQVSCAAPCAPAVYALPEKAHFRLIQMRNHLRLLASLTETGTTSRHAQVNPEAFAWWFSRLARDIDGVIDAAYWTPKLADD
jgi:hypothetical protein